jgi:hypothetical protein
MGSSVFFGQNSEMLIQIKMREAVPPTDYRLGSRINKGSEKITLIKKFCHHSSDVEHEFFEKKTCLILTEIDKGLSRI